MVRHQIHMHVHWYLTLGPLHYFKFLGEGVASLASCNQTLGYRLIVHSSTAFFFFF